MAKHPGIDPRDPSGINSILGKDVAAIEGNYIRRSPRPPMGEVDEQKSFGFSANLLLDPTSNLSQSHPQLSRVLRDRLGAAFSARKNHEFSRCDCRDQSGNRCDSPAFQENNYIPLDAFNDLSKKESRLVKVIGLCPSLKERVQLYGMIGEGTFGVIFLAREKGAPGASLEGLEQFAIKAQFHETMWKNLEERWEHTEIVTFREPNGEVRYVPEEALILMYLHDSERFPRVDSVYTHGILTAILMTPCVDPSHESVSHIDENHFNQIVTDEDPSYIYKRYPSFPVFSGDKLMSDTKQPLVNELQGNKIAAQFLQGIFELADMKIWHEDLSIFNYLIDQFLNVQLIDMGQVTFGLDSQQFQNEWDFAISFQEYQLRPERAIELEKYDASRNPVCDDACPSEVELPNDTRKTVLWKYSTLVYGFLHGFWPWEDPSPDSVKWHDQYFGTYGEHVYSAVKTRRKRMINEDVQISESLSQDCRDFLQSTLSRTTDDRPSLQEMSSFPWFSQWSSEEVESGRPLKRPFVADFHNEQQGCGRKGVPWPSASAKTDGSAIASNTSSDDEYYSCFEELPISQDP
ncbi:uncharacterized protein N7515_009725 [Penicillium bovifimosum]|uniref:Protein kinase domain-containing protein n=1 Tax=Penicillium bovifimosum TaxID=126998 RepID=A0A9W9KUE7_9EURO|nr:uncharacterized protein N7515_009725 [Penicillium bovifimosum]KAJ5120337.1 hypothetical protein N7515_009725 [Penicillium bovifimosum]